ALRELADGGVAAGADLIHDLPHVGLDVAGGRGERPHLGGGGVRPESLDPHRSSRMRATSPSISAAFSLWATGLAMSRAVDSQIASRSTSPFSTSVLPVAVRSTIASASPVSGASSTEPFTSTISACRPVAAKWAAATRGYLVATRTTPL